MASIFSKIVAGEIPSYKVAENDQFLAFLDVFPLKRGHTLVIPKKEVDSIFDLDEETYLGLMAFSKKVAAAIQRSISCNRISVHVIGLEVPHAHVHLIPINTMSDCDFSKTKLKLSAEEFTEIARSISGNMK
ncbi:MAG: HIT domain-containing protein [bacterium]|nr:HIT domain-containing protein [bacterium]